MKICRANQDEKGDNNRDRDRDRDKDKIDHEYSSAGQPAFLSSYSIIDDCLSMSVKSRNTYYSSVALV